MTTIPATADTQQKAATDDVPKTGIVADFNLFLQMLTTQMQNQDPLDPMDTSEYTQQLVQYSQVEQEMQQSTTLNNILSSLSTQGMAQASSYIGREARFDTDISGLDGDNPATWSYAASQDPASLEATVKDMQGKVVATVTLDPSKEGRFSWDGTTASGGKAADGAYTLSLAAKDGSGNDVPMTINSIGIVKEVVTDGNNVMLGVNGLRLSSGGLVAISAIDQTTAAADKGDKEPDAGGETANG